MRYLLFLFFPFWLTSQNGTGIIRGKIVDRETKQPLEGVSVQLIENSKGMYSDASGEFYFEKLSPGRYNLLFSLLGYQQGSIQSIEVSSGKEALIDFQLIESPIQLQEITIQAESDKSRATNELAFVSGRQFSVQESNKYAGGYSDPSRMAMSFAGVTSSGNDDNNEIIIRGNSPKGLLWRLEGIEIPNPNHFGDGQGSTSGIISMINSSSLANSDFLTGAFPSEFGNALSGVFDLKFRRGNDRKHEFKALIGVVGMEVAAEGPLNKSGASYRVNGRYSTLELLFKTGLVKIETDGFEPAFRDYNFTFELPTQKTGKFTLWGLGGENFSDSDYETFKDRDENKVTSTGISHQLPIKKIGYIHTVIAFSTNSHQYFRENIINGNWVNTYDETHKEQALRYTTFFNHRISSQWKMRTGIIISRLGFELNEDIWNTGQKKIINWINENGHTFSTQGYSQIKYTPNNYLQFSAGIHSLHFNLNKKTTFEPRLGMEIKTGEKSSINAGFGIHSRLEPISLYLYKRQTRTGQFIQPYKDLSPSIARHTVIGFNKRVSNHSRWVLEAYHQKLYQIPVDTSKKSFYSILNATSGIPGAILTNQGLGKNIGVEFTVEQFLYKNFYYLFTLSIFQSTYQTLDLKWRNTIFNNTFAGSAVLGKEFPIGKDKKHFLSYNIRYMLRGGNRYIPILLQESIKRKTTVLDNANAYEPRLPTFWRLDYGMAYKINKERTTWTFRIDLQNATLRKNKIRERFDNQKLQIYYNYALPLIPILAFQVDFY
ncbi:MAG: hypothetical protein RLZZ417_2904 [Bacteroidota bacterium]|jgi:hypothetical protein